MQPVTPQQMYLALVVAFVVGAVCGGSVVAIMGAFKEPSSAPECDYSRERKSALLASNQAPADLHERRTSTHPYHGVEKRSHELVVEGNVPDVWGRGN